MPEQQTEDLRKKIARRFCRVVLWIDDEINPTSPPNAMAGDANFPFQNACDDFAKNGVICQLRNFPQTTGSSDPYAPDSDVVSECKYLAKQSDVLIMDWCLGSSDSAENAKAIIGGLLNTEAGTRFIFILSKDSAKADSQASAEWSDKMTKSQDSDWYSTGNGQFVCILNKDEFSKNPQLADRVFDCLTKTYPDYLHWAALEISGKIKESTPKWLAALPLGTDWGILSERKHDPESDTRHVIFENLMEDLRFAVDCASVGIVSREVLDDAAHPFNTQYRPRIAELEQITEAQKKKAAKQLFPFSGEAKSTNVKKDLEKIISLTAPAVVPAFIKSVNSFGGFCETVSAALSEGTNIKRGAVYREDVPTLHIWICISQSCDCLRADNLLFIKAVSNNSLLDNDGHPRQPKQGDTFIQFQGKEYVISASISESLKIYPVTTTKQIEGMTLQGFVRESILTRIAARYWGHATRVGVNQPALLRAKRKGE
ncbi:MAG: hypothetical protein LBS59_08950 [Puniceicoccales bacterium]|jgi:hypothetical protein|nr:hypothetical protein [Puniceicoccales bacterium]